jgi:hypothetical protein
LIDADESDGTTALGTYYVCKAFDSLLHPQAMNELLNRGVLPDLVRPIFCMYYHIKAKICILGNDLLTKEIPIHIGVKQGAITSPTIHNNATLPAQCQLSSCCIYKGIELSILCYADDVLKTTSGLEKCFREISENYHEIGLSLNAAKCEVFIFSELGVTRVDDASIDLNGIGVKPCDKLTYLDLSIGKNLKKTKQLMLENMESKIRRSYGASRKDL